MIHARIKNKVVLIGDVHNEFVNLDRALSSEEPFDFFISVGDIGDITKMRPEDLDVIDRWKSKGYFVRGNHDKVEFFERLTIYQEINGLKVCGLNGMLKSRTFIRDTANNISYRELLYLSHLKDIDILVTHQPPTGILKGMGENALQDLLMYMIPKVYAFGHVHIQEEKFIYNTACLSLPLIKNGHAVLHFEGSTLVNLEKVTRKGKEFIKI